MLVDSTMFLSKKQWLKVMAIEPLIKEDYISLYNKKQQRYL